MLFILFYGFAALIALLIGFFNWFYGYRVGQAQEHLKINLPKPLFHLLHFDTFFPFGVAAFLAMMILLELIPS